MTKRIPEDMHTLTPHIVCKDAIGAIAFYEKAFGAHGAAVMKAPNGMLMHGMVRIGDSTLMLMEENPDCGAQGPVTLKGSPVTLHMYVEDADATFARAIAAGATAVMPPADMFWGDRYGVLKDPYGHNWAIAHHQRDMTPAEMQEAAATMFS